jgi:hypothetical protein
VVSFSNRDAPVPPTVAAPKARGASPPVIGGLLPPTAIHAHPITVTSKTNNLVTFRILLPSSIRSTE